MQFTLRFKGEYIKKKEKLTSTGIGLAVNNVSLFLKKQTQKQ